MASLVSALLPKMSGGSEFAVFFDDERRRAVLRGLFDAYYGASAASQVVFDTNRTWTGRAALLHELFPEARIICCVREVSWIIDSIERLLRQNPLQLSRIFNFQAGSSIYARCEMLMNSESGVIGLAWSNLREAWFGENAKNLILVNYDKLVREPQTVVARLYQELHENPFHHDFDNVSYDAPDFDDGIGMPGLHKVRPKIEFRTREACIPPDLFAKYADANFWSRPGLNSGGVTVL
jgi:sulfotransferase